MGDRGLRAAQLLKQSGAAKASTTGTKAAAPPTTKAATTKTPTASTSTSTPKTAAASKGAAAKASAPKSAAKPAAGAAVQGAEGLVRDIEAGKLQAVQARLKQERPNQQYHPDPQDPGLYCTPLIAAVRAGSADMVTALLDAGADAAGVDSAGATALHCLAATPSLKEGPAIAAALLRSSPSTITALDAQHRSPLHAAALSGNAAVLALLAAAPGADLEAQHPGCPPPLHAAAQSLHLDCVDTLLAAGAALSSQDHLGRTALMTLIQAGQAREAVLLLLKGDCNVNAVEQASKHSALMMACQHQAPDLALIHQLLASGASPDAMDPSDHTSVMTAIASQPVPLALALIQGSRNIQQVNSRQESALSLALKRGEDALVVAVLEASAPDVGPQALQLLSSSLEEKRDDVAAVLIKMVKAPQLSALDLDVRRLLAGELPAAALALAQRLHGGGGGAGAGPDCALDAEGNSLLHVAAAAAGTPGAVCAALLRLGLGPNHPNKADGATPLHAAARSGNVAACQALLDGGADPTRRNAKNRTPCNQPKIPDATREYLLGIEAEYAQRRDRMKSDMFGSKIQATQTESAFGVRAL